MDPTTVVILMLIALIIMVIMGVHIGISLGITALVGTWMMYEAYELAAGQVGSASFFALRNFIFAVVPLFVLMGEFVSRSGSAGDLYRVMNFTMKRVPGRLAVATVAGNAIFAAVTGTSLASAAAFSRLAYPEMIAAGYSRKFALGSVAGSACLGMLIPPSVLLIIWGIVTEISIGFLFLSGILPGIVLATLMALYSSGTAILKPEVAPTIDSSGGDKLTRQEIISGSGVIALIFVVLGTIWGGLTTPSEAAAIGALGGLILALIKGVRWDGIRESIIDSGKVIAPILFLLVTAQMYARLLTTGGITGMITEAITGSGLDPNLAILVMIVIWLILGMLLDSGSIILLTVPIFWPIAQAFGYNEYAFAIMGILAIEAGLLTPPVGLLVYAVKGAVPDKTVQLSEIFSGSIPYWILMLFVLVLVWILPDLATEPIVWSTDIKFNHQIGFTWR
ncbi:MAG: C4-dicarboxylate ABC transporter permease [Alphaproteobacteria bacterium]|jgi:C4-dicarboxylate transporter DctM subunit|nr:C4-dicarboxylate ABC transporter permease [Alphaproteobacteria bacterium]PPR13123.1 MAG: C4-dicarboxylate TRAP transporter large permease protein DctM [Alphaproteobacteria bacterium MarineAlpha12_Bin1]|tara:strand:+ start:3949 stop:5298 length:1350 start_codon:yes stop_codon:yes gene_type:complete